MLFIQQLATNPRYFFAWIIVMVISVCLHELAHGVVAVWLGDNTPIEEERLTLNPLVHMGPTALICLFLAGITWGAMPINPNRMRWRYADALCSFAGPLCNAILGTIALLAYGYWFRHDPRPDEDLGQYAQNGRFLLLLFGQANVLLALFKLIPFPPLDGSHILGNFIPAYANFADSLLHNYQSLYLQGSVLLFCVAGYFLWPVAGHISANILELALK